MSSIAGLDPVLRASARLLVSLCVLVALPAPAFGAERMMFPARASDLPSGAVWNMTGDHGGSNSRDLNVVRPSGGGWTDRASGGGSGNSGRLLFGVPLYAPVDGTIVSCWSGHPDNPRPGTPAPERCCNGNCSISCDDSSDCPASAACKIARAGNHVAIQKSNGDVVVLAHLKTDSIPGGVCPNRAKFMTNARSRLGDFPAESFLWLCGEGPNPSSGACVQSRPRVELGQFIGRAGNSGASSGPHLHVQTTNIVDDRGVLKKDGPILQTKLNFGWLRHRSNESVWKPFRTDAVRNPPVIVEASPFLRRASASAGSVRHTATLLVSSNRAVTATIAHSNRALKLTGWDLVGLDRINRRGSIEAGAANAVFLSEVAPNLVLAAVHQADGDLKMIAYQVTPTGGFVRRAQRSAGRITHLDMATIAGIDRKAVTALRDGDGNLKLIAWDIKVANDGSVSVERLGQAQAGRVTALAVARARNFSGVFTAVRDSAGKLKLTAWKLSSDGQRFTRGGSVTAGTATSEIDVLPLAAGVAAAVRDGDGKLRVMTWSVSSSGSIVTTRRSTETAGKATDIHLVGAPHGGSNFATVVSSGDSGDLFLIGWAVDGDGRGLRRLGSTRSGSASAISADVVSRSFSGGPRDILLTSMRGGDGKLRLISWDTNLVDP